MLQRTTYLDHLSSLSGKGVIAVLVGMRRIGKSTVLHQYADHVGPEQCLTISKELPRFDNLRDYHQLYDYIHQHLGTKRYIMIDEVQMIDGREQTVNGLLAEYGTSKDIIITGSNSDLLSTELSTLLRGRTFEIPVYPFSFEEYRTYKQLSLDASSFTQYLQQGGMPSLYAFDEQQQQTRMEGLINTVFLKDIVGRFAIKDVDLLKAVRMYVVNSVGDQSNLANIKNYLVQQGYHINLNTIGNYVEYLTKSLMINQVDMYDIQGKRILDRMRKFYTADHAMRRYLFSGFDSGGGKLLENYVYVSLCRAGYHVTVGRYKDKEIDFIAEKQGCKIYVQVCYILSDQHVVEREFDPLLAIQDNWPKVVISLDPISLGMIDGIEHIQARQREEMLKKKG